MTPACKRTILWSSWRGGCTGTPAAAIHKKSQRWRSGTSASSDVKLPELNPKAAPPFVDAQALKTWLQSVPLANVTLAQQDLLGELESFNSFPTSGANRLPLLEALREPG